MYLLVSWGVRMLHLGRARRKVPTVGTMYLLVPPRPVLNGRTKLCQLEEEVKHLKLTKFDGRRT